MNPKFHLINADVFPCLKMTDPHKPSPTRNLLTPIAISNGPYNEFEIRCIIFHMFVKI